MTAAPFAAFAARVPWTGLTNMPAGFADGLDDNTTYSAGPGLVLNGTEFSEVPIENLLTVSPAGGDFSSIQAAVDSVTDASENNPYLIWIGPGTYSEPVVSKAYVHLQGSGPDLTILSSDVSTDNFPPDVATLTLSSQSSVSELTVRNEGAGTRNVTILVPANTVNVRLNHAKSEATGAGTINYGLYALGPDSEIVLEDVDIEVFGAVDSYGRRPG